MDRGIREEAKENPRAILKALFLVGGILELRQRQAPDDYIALQVTNPRISVCTSTVACIPLSFSPLGLIKKGVL
ncbi:MAG: hypothetical protein U5P10_10575 [Spirochaetia bacterium]|nr:hypothetical protein [Spirochaetia bacterium]MDZ7794106.1 hypothetical protein [Spirochaetia bacterium]